MALEWQILEWIQGMRTPVGDVIMPLVTILGNAGILWIVLAVILLVSKTKRKSGQIVAVALCVNALLCNVLLKNLVARPRPCDIHTAVTLLIDRPADFSFPSGHTAISVAAVTALYLAGESRLWKPALVLTVFIAFSRMYLYVHFPSDILGGIAVGMIAGYVAWRLVEKAGKISKK